MVSDTSTELNGLGYDSGGECPRACERSSLRGRHEKENVLQQLPLCYQFVSMGFFLWIYHIRNQSLRG
jgi:hypothetical protein